MRLLRFIYEEVMFHQINRFNLISIYLDSKFQIESIRKKKKGLCTRGPSVKR